jgi:hypothetical protein
VYDDTGDLYDLLTHCSDEIEFIKADNLEQAIHGAQTVPAHAVVINTTANHHPELLEQARKSLPDTPLILGAFPSRPKNMLEAGAVNQLIKPIMRADLEKAMQAVGKPVKSILIVDDDHDFRQLLRRMLLMNDDTLYQVFLQVVLPLVRPAIGTLFILFSLEGWNDLLWPLIVLRSDEKFTLAVGISGLVGLYRERWDLVMAGAFLATFPIVILFLFMQKQFIAGISSLGSGVEK